MTRRMVGDRAAIAHAGEATELQLRRLAQLERACAQRAAGEACAAELVEQARLKVRQFEAQNAANLADAEQALAGISQELEGSLMRQQACEAEADEAAKRVKVLQVRVGELAAARDAAMTRRRVQVNTGAELQKLAVEEHEAKETVLQRLHHLDLDAGRLRAEGAAADASHKELLAEFAELHHRVAGLRQRDLAANVMYEHWRCLLVHRAFGAFVRGCIRARRQRVGVLRLRSVVDGRLALEALVVWESRSREGRRDARQRAGRRLMLSQCAGAWRLAAGRAIRRRRLRVLAGTLRQVLSRWQRAAVTMGQPWQHAIACMRHLACLRSSRAALRAWAAAVALVQRRRSLARGLALRQQRATLGSAFRCLRLLRGQAGPRSQERQLAEWQRRRVCAAPLQGWRRHVRRQRCLRDAAVGLAGSVPPLARGCLLRRAFDAFRLRLGAAGRVESLLAETLRQLRQEVTSLVLPEWRSAVLLSRREAAAAEVMRSRRQRDACRRWREWACTTARSRWRLSAPEVEARRGQGSAVGALRWWRSWATVRNLAARRAYTIEERRQLSACRWALRLWDAAVRASAREDCAGIAERVRCAREAAASWEEARASCQRHRRSAEESRLRAAELRAEVGVVLSELQEEQEAKVHWAHEAATAQAEAALRLQQGRRDLAGIERQLEEAVNMQMSLRFVLRQGEAEADAVRARRALQEERSAELTDRLNEAQSAYVHAIDLLDATVIRLEREGQAAEGKAHHVEDALDEAAFKCRMCDIELQRWRARQPQVAVEAARVAGTP